MKNPHNYAITQLVEDDDDFFWSSHDEKMQKREAWTFCKLVRNAEN